MPQCGNRVVDQHTWAGIAHHLFHLFAVVRLVAVYRAFLASTFVFSKLASVQSAQCVADQFLTLRTGVLPMMMCPAV